jgi:hypothetical protein
MSSDLTHFLSQTMKISASNYAVHRPSFISIMGILLEYIYTSQPKISVKRYTITKHIDKCTKVLIVLYSNNNNKPPSFCGQILNYNVLQSTDKKCYKIY